MAAPYAVQTAACCAAQLPADKEKAVAFRAMHHAVHAVQRGRALQAPLLVSAALNPGGKKNLGD